MFSNYYYAKVSLLLDDIIPFLLFNMTTDQNEANRRRDLLNLLNLPENVLGSLVRMLRMLLYEGNLFAVRDREGNILYYNRERIDQEEIDQIDSTENYKYFQGLIQFVQTVSAYLGQEVSATMFGLSENYESKTHYLQKKLSEEGIMPDFLYPSNTAGNRIVPNTIKSKSKLLPIRIRDDTILYPAVDIKLQTNSNGDTHDYFFELGHLDLRILISALNKIERELRENYESSKRK